MLVAAVGATAIAAAAAFIAPSVLAAPGATTMHLREAVTNATFIDVGRKGISQGDFLAWDDPLRDVGSGKAAGRVSGVCTLVDLRSQLYNCSPVTLTLSGGSIYVDGFFSGKGKPEIDPIVGGTGKYQNIHGTATVTPVSSTVNDFVVSIES